MREIAIGLHRTYLDNGYWVNTVLTPIDLAGGRFHTVIYPLAGVCAPVTQLRSEREEDWPADHMAAVEWARGQKRTTTKDKGQAFGPRKQDAA